MSYLCKYKINSVFILIFMLLLLSEANSQNIHFSNIYVTHLTLNPANIGNFNGDMRAVVLYRAQGYNISNPYETFYTSFEKPFFPLGQQIDVGLNYSYDNSAGFTFPGHYLFLSLAKKVNITRTLKLSAGLQLGYVSKQFDSSSETFPDQYNRSLGAFDSSLPTADTFERSTSNNLTTGIGILALKSMKDMILSAGISIQNLNRPTENYFGMDYQVDMRNIVHLKMDYSFAQNLFILPAIVFVNQGNVNQTLVGSNVGYKSINNKAIKSLSSGVFIRNGIVNNIESLVFSIGIGVAKWNFFSSYEFDISGLKSSYTKNSGFEFGLIYILPNSKIEKIIHPTERF